MIYHFRRKREWEKFLMNNLLEKLPQKIKKKILATLISTLRNEEEISNEDEELAQKVLDKIKELK